MSLIKVVRRLFGQKLLQNTAGFRVVSGSGSSGKWISDGESLALVPEGVQEVQFPVDVMGIDSVTASVQVSVLFTYDVKAETFFNFAYDVDGSVHTGNFADATKKAIISTLAPKVAEVLQSKPIAEMVKVTSFAHDTSGVVSDSGSSTQAPKVSCDGIVIRSIMLAVKPKDSAVLSALGSQKTEELLRLANSARQETRLQAIAQSAILRTKEHAQSIAAVAEAQALIAEQAKNDLARAESDAAAKATLSKQEAEAAKAMVLSFGNDPMAYALHALATEGGDVTVTTEFLSALRNNKK